MKASNLHISGFQKTSAETVGKYFAFHRNF